MSKNHVRSDMTCLNCNCVVEKRFCPNCGQENVEPHKSFSHIVYHFIEDLTHYEGAFWKTIKHLLFKPALLTNEYLSGKRMHYLAPIRLYLFISFLTFLTFTNSSNTDGGFVKINKTTEIIDSLSITSKKIVKLNKEGQLTNKEKDSIIKYIQESESKFSTISIFKNKYSSIDQLDSIQKFGKESEKLNTLQYWFGKKLFKTLSKNSQTDLIEKFKSAFAKNFSKLLIIYMPFFAFIVWLFHNKKRWFYFDSAIFTLHYFSFILLISFIYVILESIVYLIFPFSDLINNFFEILGICLFVWAIIYFYKSHKRLFIEKKYLSFFKSTFILLLNFILFFIILLFYFLYTFINIK